MTQITWAEKTSVDVRQKLGLNPYEPLPATQLAKYLSVHVTAPHELADVPDEIVNCLYEEGKSHWSAATICVFECLTIILNTKHSVARQESDMMHELAHVICEHKMTEISQFQNTSILLRDHNQQNEDEADWLGGCLQLPKKALLWAKGKDMSEEDISIHFTASRDMVRKRINTTGLRKLFS